MLTTEQETEELLETLRSTELFEVLDDDELRQVAQVGEVLHLERGEYLFHRSDPSDCIHLVLDGAIEIVRPTNESPQPVPVAYVSPGELIGDMALFTGTPRRSDGRVPQRARVWTLTRVGFEQVAAELPAYGMELTRMFARRLQDLITHMRRQARRKELAGELRYFDMPTVVQTLITAGQTGLLTFVNDSGEVYAEVMLRNGTIDRARCGQLEGEEAFHEIFLHKDDGQFYFRSLVDPDPAAVSEVDIATPAMHLMMEAMRRADEMVELREKLDGTNRRYQAKTKQVDWQEPRTAAAAEAIVGALAKPRTLEELRGRVPCSTFGLYRIAAELVEKGQIS